MADLTDIEGASRIKELINGLFKEYEEYLAPIKEVRTTLTRELKGKGKLSDLIVKLRENNLRWKSKLNFKYY